MRLPFVMMYLSASKYAKAALLSYYSSSNPLSKQTKQQQKKSSKLP